MIGITIGTWRKEATTALSVLLAWVAVDVCLGAEPEHKIPVPTIKVFLRNREGVNRSDNAVTVSGIELNSEAAVPALIELLKDKDGHVRMAAVELLEGLDAKAKPAIPALTKLLKDKDRDVRKIAGEALGLFGPEAKAAVPILVELLKDGQSIERIPYEGAIETTVPSPDYELIMWQA